MKKKRNFLLPLLMAIVMMAMSPTRMWADSQFTYKATEDLSGTFQNAFGNGTVTCGTWTDKNTEVTVTVAGTVTSIGEYAFFDCDDLTSITLPSSVTSIGDHAFYDCNGLTSITLPSSVTSIGDGAFFSCNGLTSITLPSSVTSIADDAFNSCVGLVYVYCEGESPATLGESVFVCYNNLVAIVVPADGVESYKTDWSEYSEKIVSANSCITYTASEQLTLSFNPKSHSYNAGTGIIIFENDLTSIDGNVFYFLDNLTSISLPSSLTSIADDAFNSCEKLTSITFPDGLKSIGNNAFAGCSCLTDVSFSSIPQVGSKAFDDCTNLNTITLTLTDGSYVASDKGDFPTLTEATFTRTMTTEWETVVLPFAVTISENDNYEICTVDGVTGSYLLAKKATGTLAAGTPVLIRKKVTGNYDLILTASNTTVNTAISNPAAVSGLTLTGTYATAPVALGAGYVFNGTTFSMTTAATDVAPFHAYLSGNIQGVSTITPHIHTITAHSATVATCDEDGNNAYWSCEVCGMNFSDEAGENGTTLADVTVAATGHNFTSKTLSATADSEGLYHYVCANGCGTADSENANIKVIKDYAPNAEGAAKNLELTVTTEGETTTYSTTETIALTDANQFASVNVSFSTTQAPTYTRANINNEWGTIVLPFAVAAQTDDYDLYSCETTVDNYVVLRVPNSETVAAGTPAFLRKKTTAESITFTATGNAAGTSYTVNTADLSTPSVGKAMTLCGTYAALPMTSSNTGTYFIYNNAFWNVSQLSDGQEVTIMPFHAYIQGESEAGTGGMGDAKLSIVVADNATGIGQVTSISPLGESEGAMYNLNGQRLAAPHKGVNIINGKKVMVK